MPLVRKCNCKYCDCCQHKYLMYSSRNHYKRYEVEKYESHFIIQQHHNHKSSTDGDYEFNRISSTKPSQPVQSADPSSPSSPFPEIPNQPGEVTTKINGNHGVLNDSSDPSVIVQDPRTFTNKNEYMSIDLPDSEFTPDKDYIGQHPGAEVTFSNLNDNIDKKFLNDLVIQFGKIDLVQIFYHPISKKHLGLAKIIFKKAASAKCCVQKLNKTSVIGKVVNVFLDSLAIQCNIMFEKLTGEISKQVPTTNQVHKSVKSHKYQEEHVKTQSEQKSPQSRVDNVQTNNSDHTILYLATSDISSVYCQRSIGNSEFNRTYPNNKYPCNVTPVLNDWKNGTSPVYLPLELIQLPPPAPNMDTEAQSKKNLATDTQMLLNEKDVNDKPAFSSVANKDLDNVPDSEAQSKTILVTDTQMLLNEKYVNDKPAFSPIANNDLDNVPNSEAQSKTNVVPDTEMLLNEKDVNDKPAFSPIANNDLDNVPGSEAQSKTNVVPDNQMLLNEKNFIDELAFSSVANKDLDNVPNSEAQSKTNVVPDTEMLLNEKDVNDKPAFSPIANNDLDNVPDSEAQSKTNVVSDTEMLPNEKDVNDKPAFSPIANNDLDNVPNSEAQSKTNVVPDTEMLLNEKDVNDKPAFSSVVNKDLDNVPDSEFQSKTILVTDTQMLLNEKYVNAKPAFSSVANKDLDNVPDSEAQSKTNVIPDTEMLPNEKDVNDKPAFSSIENKDLDNISDSEAQSKKNLATDTEMLPNEKDVNDKPAFSSIENKDFDNISDSEAQPKIILVPDTEMLPNDKPAFSSIENKDLDIISVSEAQSKKNLATGTQMLLNEKDVNDKPAFSSIENKDFDNISDSEAQPKINLVPDTEMLPNDKPAFSSIENKDLDNISDSEAQSKKNLATDTEMLPNEKDVNDKPAFSSIENKDFDNISDSEAQPKIILVPDTEMLPNDKPAFSSIENKDLDIISVSEAQSKKNLATGTQMLLNEKDVNDKPAFSSIENKDLDNISDSEAQSKKNLATDTEMLPNEKDVNDKPAFSSVANKDLDNVPDSEDNNSICLDLFVAPGAYDSQSDSDEENVGNEEELLLPLSYPPSPFLSKDVYNKSFQAAAEQLKIWREKEKLEAKIFNSSIRNVIRKSLGKSLHIESLQSDPSVSDDESMTGESSKSNTSDDRMSLSSFSSHSEKIFENNSNIIPTQVSSYPPHGYPHNHPNLYVPKQHDDEHNIKTFLMDIRRKYMNKVKRELKLVIKHDLMDKMIFSIAFNVFDQWWEEIERQSKSACVVNEKLKSTQPTPHLNSILESETEDLEMLDLSDFGLGFRAAVPKMTHFHKSPKKTNELQGNRSDLEEMVSSSDNEYNVIGQASRVISGKQKQLERELFDSDSSISFSESSIYCSSNEKKESSNSSKDSGDEFSWQNKSKELCKLMTMDWARELTSAENETHMAIDYTSSSHEEGSFTIYKSNGKLETINQLSSQKQYDNQVTNYFNKRDMEKEYCLLYEFFNMGIDMEDINYLKQSYELLQSCDANHNRELFKASWISHPVTADIPYGIPHKKKNSDWKIHYTGCSRSEGYYKVDSIQKAKYKYHFGHSNAQLTTKKKYSNNMLTLSREVRSNQLRLSRFGTTSYSDLLKFNQLKLCKKKLKFGKSAIHDWGLFAMEPIALGAAVIEYAGQIIRPVVADLREKKYETTGIGSSYLFKMDVDTIIDATKFGNMSRFINHSCNPNCYAKVIQIEGMKKIVIYSKRSISKNEEITYDYKFPLEENKILCRCGTRGCRGTLN